MSTAEIKLQIIRMLSDSVDDSTLLKVFRLLSNSSSTNNTDWTDELPAEIEKSLQQAIKEDNAGKVVSHDLVLKELRKEFPHLKI